MTAQLTEAGFQDIRPYFQAGMIKGIVCKEAIERRLENEVKSDGDRRLWTCGAANMSSIK